MPRLTTLLTFHLCTINMKLTIVLPALLLSTGCQIPLYQWHTMWCNAFVCSMQGPAYICALNLIALVTTYAFSCL